MAEFVSWSLIVLALYVIAWIRWSEAPKDAQKEFTAVVTDRRLSVSPLSKQHRLAVRVRHDRMIAVADSLIGLCFVATIGSIGTTQSFLFSLPVAVIFGLTFRLLASRVTTNANRRFAQPQVRLAKLDPRDLNRYLPGPERLIQLVVGAFPIGAIGIASSSFADEFDSLDRAWAFACLVTGTAVIIFIFVDEMAASFALTIYEEKLQLVALVSWVVLAQLIEFRHGRVAKRFPLQEIQPA